VATEDTTPPKIENITPVDSVQQACSVSVEFDDPILESTVTPDSFQILSDGSENPLTEADGTWGLSPDNNKIIIFKPSGNLIGSYKVTVTTDIANVAELNLENGKSWTFTASQACSTSGGGDTTPPKFLNGIPEGQVDQICSITAEFDEPILESTISDQSFIIQSATSDTPLGSGDGTWSLSPSNNTIALFQPSVDLVGTYTVKITTDITDTAGNNLAGPQQSWAFTAAQACSTTGGDIKPPQFLNGDPVGPVVQACAITAEFDEPILESSVTAQSFVIQSASSATPLTSVDGTWGLSPSSGTIALFEPSVDLVGTYTVKITTDITDTAGNNLTGNQSWAFTTSQACSTGGGDTTPPQFITGEPQGAVNNVCLITAEFDEAILESSVTNQSFIIQSTAVGASPISSGDGTWGLSATNDAIAIFVPAISLVGEFRVTITTGIANTAGLNLAADESWTFTASLPCPP